MGPPPSHSLEELSRAAVRARVQRPEGRGEVAKSQSQDMRGAVDETLVLPPKQDAPQVGADPPAVSFPIVGIGASAGGLAALAAFFSAMPTDTECGMAFVLVRHLAPDHKSILAELVRRHTRMQVYEVEDGMVVQPNCAYAIPPGPDMALLHGALHLLEPAAVRGVRLPIDFFFRSLAEEV